MLGQYDAAIERYTEALHIYEDIAGRQNTSYATTLYNIGVLYKTMASESDKKGIEKSELLQRSEEALGDSYKIRASLLGDAHKDTILSEVQLAGLKRLQAKAFSDKSSTGYKQNMKSCFDLLEKSLAAAKQSSGDDK